MNTTISLTRKWVPLCLIGLSAFTGILRAAPATWAPVTANNVTSVPASGFVVDTANRMECLSFYNTVFLASEGAETRAGWTGSFGSNCNRGTTNADFREDIRRRVNYYRAMCGLPADITFDADLAVNDGTAGSPQVTLNTTKRTCAQASAYMNSFSNVFFDNYVLSHNPNSSNTVCYSANAWNGSAHCNLAIGYFGPRAIDVYMEDDDISDDQSNNVNVGHRRWILYSRAKDMATGDVPAGSYSDGTTTYPVLPSNALYVTGTSKPAASVTKQFVSWPSKGYLPQPLLPARWSLSYPGATFATTSASVTLTGPTGATIPVSIISSNQSSHGDNTVVFAPSSLPVLATGDSTYTATVTGISGSGVPVSYSWQTILFDPYALGVNQTMSGPALPPKAGADYQFTAAPLAGNYQVLVSQPAAATTYIENAEATTPDLSTSKTGTYPVVQAAGSLNGLNFTPRGTKSLHLCFPLDSSEIDFLPHTQAFTLGSEFIPASDSTVSFAEHFRWLFTTNRLSLELSSDGGNKFTEIYGRDGGFTYAAGASYSSTGWDTSWNTRSVSLATWAGQPIKLRFILRPGLISFDGQDINHGCYIDDITLARIAWTGAYSLSCQRGTTAASYQEDIRRRIN